MSLIDTIREIEMRDMGEPEGSPAEAMKLAGALRESYDEAAIKRVAGLVKRAFEEVGATDTWAYHVYRGLRKNPAVDKQARELASIGYQCLGRALIKVKSAKGFGWPTAFAQDAMKTIALVGAGAGVPLGGGAWMINRGLKNQDKDIRAMEIQRDTYGRLAQEVEDELRRRNLDPTPENVAATVDYLT